MSDLCRNEYINILSYLLFWILPQCVAKDMLPPDSDPQWLVCAAISTLLVHVVHSHNPRAHHQTTRESQMVRQGAC